MADPFRLRVQKALATKLEEIATTYEGVSMSGRVFRGRALFGEGDPIPMISILEEPIQEDPREGPSRDTATVDYRLMLQGFVSDDKENPTDPAHYLMADVLKKLAEVVIASRPTGNVGQNAESLLGFPEKYPTVMRLDFGPGVVRPPDDEISAKAYFWLPVSLQLVEKFEDPYAS